MNEISGLILAGGTGSRLAPLTKVVNKHLLPVFDKPMIYYPLTTLMLAGIRRIVVVTSPECIAQFEALLGEGSKWGLRLSYRAQHSPDGIVAGMKVAAPDLHGKKIALVLGDNIFFGAGFPSLLEASISTNVGATIFGHEVANPSAFGVVTLNADGEPISIEEKPAHPTSRIAVTGLYIYSSDVFELADQVRHSQRKEFEITDLNRIYLGQGRLRVRNLGRGTAWLDGGTTKDLYEAGQFVKVVQERTGQFVACPEEIAYRKGFIDRSAFTQLVEGHPISDFRAYLQRVLQDPSIDVA